MKLRLFTHSKLEKLYKLKVIETIEFYAFLCFRMSVLLSKNREKKNKEFMN